MDQQRYKLIVHTPPTHLQQIKEAIFATPGAGTIGLYDRVCFCTTGTCEFVPGKDATPFLGTPGVREEVAEVRVEVQVRGREGVRRAVEGVRKIHPYEEPVYEVYKIEDF